MPSLGLRRVALGLLEDDVSIDHVVDLYWDLLSRPMATISLFYSLYFLVEIERVEEARFDFVNLRNRLEEGLMDYGVYSVLRELSHVFNQYEFSAEVNGFDRKSVGSWLVRGRENLVKRHVENDVEGVQQVKILAKNLLLNSRFLSAARKRTAVATEDGHKEFLFTARNLVGPERFSNVELLLTTARALFENEENWDPLFGGKSWGAVCTHLLRRDDLPKTAWVDQSFSVQHNTGAWLNKVEPELSDSEVAVETFGGELNGDRVTLPTGETEDLVDAVWEFYVDRLLDAVQGGDIDTVLNVAENFSQNLSINIRRFRRIL